MGGGASAVVGVLVVFGHTPARCARVPFRKAKGEGNGVLCFTLGSRVRGNDGACGNDGVVCGNDGVVCGNDGVVRGNDGVVRGNDGVVRGDGRGW